MEKNYLISLLPNTEELENKCIAYLFKNPLEVYLLPESYFFNDKCKTIRICLQELLDKELEFDIDTLYQICTRNNSSVTKQDLNDIFSISVNENNINFYKDSLKENYTRHKTSQYLEDIIIHTTSRNFNKEYISKQIDKISNKLYDLDGDILLDTEKLSDDHRKVLEERKKGITKRSLGYKALDRLLLKPAAPGEMTAICAFKGGCKSILAKSIENLLINNIQNITPVVSINLEMTQESSCDRLLCLRTGISMEDLVKKDKDARLEAKINRGLDDFSKRKNYLYYPESSLSLSQLDGLLYKAKGIFRQRGLLKYSDYILTTIDLADMIDEISKAESYYQIKCAADQLHRIFRKHNSHGLLLLQANENKIRNGKIFKNSDDLDHYKIGFEDIKGGSVYADRCRVVFTLTRPLQMKKRFFPEEYERWNLETDFVNINLIKQNDGPEGFVQFVLGNNFHLYPYVESTEECE